MNFHLLGHQCHVEYAGGSSALSNNHQNFGNRKLMVARIPENVTEIDLHHLFFNCHILKYCPARTVHSSATTTTIKGKSKTIWGYEQLTYRVILPSIKSILFTPYVEWFKKLSTFSNIFSVFEG